MIFEDASWRPGERWKVYGGTARTDCVIYRRDNDKDQVGRPTEICGPYDDLEKLASELNALISLKRALQ